jgi:hypothetical protein
LIPSVAISVFQNTEVKSLSLLLIITLGILWYLTILLTKIIARDWTMKSSLYTMKWVYFVSLSITTNIESYLFPIGSSTDPGSFVMKSIVISS